MGNQIKKQNAITDCISEIAKIIRQDWKNIYFGAKPYLEAMMHIRSIHDYYYEDSADMVVSYFLGNAQTWRGETTRAAKAKLNQFVKQARETS